MNCINYKEFGGFDEDDEDDDEDDGLDMISNSTINTNASDVVVEWPANLTKFPQCFLCKRFSNEKTPLISQKSSKWGGLIPWNSYRKVKKADGKGKACQRTKYPKGQSFS